jgi:hypothetical protein
MEEVTVKIRKLGPNSWAGDVFSQNPWRTPWPDFPIHVEQPEFSCNRRIVWKRIKSWCKSNKVKPVLVEDSNAPS